MFSYCWLQSCTNTSTSKQTLSNLLKTLKWSAQQNSHSTLNQWGMTHHPKSLFIIRVGGNVFIFYSKVCRFIYYFIEGKKSKTSPLTLQRAWTDLVAVNLFWSHTGEKLKKQIDIVGIATTRNLQCLQWSVCAFISCIIYLSRGMDRKRSDFITDQDVLPCALAINL